MKHPYRLLVVLTLFAVLIGAVPAGASGAPTLIALAHRHPGRVCPRMVLLARRYQHRAHGDVNGMEVVLGDLRGKKILAASDRHFDGQCRHVHHTDPGTLQCDAHHHVRRFGRGGRQPR